MIIFSSSSRRRRRRRSISRSYGVALSWAILSLTTPKLRYTNAEDLAEYLYSGLLPWEEAEDERGGPDRVPRGRVRG